MLPTVNSVLTQDISIITQPSKNYKMNLREEFIKDYADELLAMEQVIYKIIFTERYRHIIYSWNYGIELEDLFGEAVSYVCSEVERRITDALVVDDRIKTVENFEFDTSKKHIVAVKFDVVTIFGVVSVEKEVKY